MVESSGLLNRRRALLVQGFESLTLRRLSVIHALSPSGSSKLVPLNRRLECYCNSECCWYVSNSMIEHEKVTGLHGWALLAVVI